MLKRFVLTALVLGFSASLFSQVNPDSLPEKYVKKVIIDAKWGNGPGEFGLEPVNETYTWTTHLTIDSEGNFYIVDPNNCRINIYSQNGKFLHAVKIPPQFYSYDAGDTVAWLAGIGVDSKKFIYIGIGIDSFDSNERFIAKLDRNGKIVEKYILKGICAEGLNFFEDENGAVHVWASWLRLTHRYGALNYIGDALLSLPKIREIKKTRVSMVDEIGRLSPQSFEIINKKERRELSSLNLDDINEGEWRIHTGAAPVSFRVVKKKSKEYIMYEDWEGNIMIESGNGVLFKESVSSLNTWSFRHPKYGILNVSADAVFDKDGNFYLIKGDSTGLKVIKYIIDKEVWK